VSCVTNSFLTERINATKAEIAAYEDAVLALGTSGGVQEYLIDTGQTKQRVTRADLKDINSVIDSLYNRLVTLCARRDGTGNNTIGRPDY